jgi:hypothetical protein
MRILSKTLPTVPIRLMAQKEEDKVGSFLGFYMDTTGARFNAGEKYCLRRTAISTFTRKILARFGRCLKNLFGIPFRPGDLPTLIT